LKNGQSRPLPADVALVDLPQAVVDRGFDDALFVLGAGGAGELGQKDRTEESVNQEREQRTASGKRVVH